MSMAHSYPAQYALPHCVAGTAILTLSNHHHDRFGLEHLYPLFLYLVANCRHACLHYMQRQRHSLHRDRKLFSLSNACHHPYRHYIRPNKHLTDRAVPTRYMFTTTHHDYACVCTSRLPGNVLVHKVNGDQTTDRCNLTESRHIVNVTLPPAKRMKGRYAPLLAAIPHA